MARKPFATLLLAAFCLSFSARAGAKQWMVLHVTPDGRQEAMRIEPGQTMKDVISKIEKGAQFSPFDVRESLTNAVGLLNVNFGFVHQDVGFELMDIGRRDITKRNSIPLRSEAVSISIASQREVFPQ